MIDHDGTTTSNKSLARVENLHGIREDHTLPDLLF